MKTSAEIVNSAPLDQLLALTTKLTENNPEARKELAEIRANIRTLPQDLEKTVGEKIVNLLHLKPMKDSDWYSTDKGCKSALGIFRSIQNELEEVSVTYEPVTLEFTPLI